jgi:hypothetical protein
MPIPSGLGKRGVAAGNVPAATRFKAAVRVINHNGIARLTDPVSGAPLAAAH